MKNIVLVIMLVVSVTYTQNTNVAISFLIARIVPEVIPVPPQGYLTVIYPLNVVVNLGNLLKVSQVVRQPSVSFPQCQSNTLYSLLMVDPDALYPGLSLPGEYCHWVVYNIPCVNGDLDIRSGNTLAFYLLPTPPPISKPHRYTFLLFAQPGTINPSLFQALTSNARAVFSTQSFVLENKLGVPVAGNFYYGVTDINIPLI